MQLTSPIFRGRVVIITGAGNGLGRAHALAFAAEGARVVVNDVGADQHGAGGGKEAADKVAAEIGSSGGEAIAHHGSIASFEGASDLVDAAKKAYGRVDVLVHNARILRDKTLLKMDEDMWDAVVAVHLKGAFACMQAFARQVIEEQHPGRIINTTSVAALNGSFGRANYAAAKAGVAALTLTGAIELKKHGITVNAIAPLAKTRMTETIEEVPASMTPEQVSPMVLFLASEAAAGITGQVFGIHGQHMFAYKTQTTEGVRKHSDIPWTPEQLRRRIDDIMNGEPPYDPRNQNPALKSAQAPVPVGETAVQSPAKVSAAPSAAPRPRRSSVEDFVLPPGPGVNSSDPVEQMFSYMPLGFRLSKSEGKQFRIYFDIKDGPSHTVSLEDGVFKVIKGKEGEPTSVIGIDASTVVGIFSGAINAEKAFTSGKFTTSKLADIMALGMVLSAKQAQAAIMKLHQAPQAPADAAAEADSRPPASDVPPPVEASSPRQEEVAPPAEDPVVQAFSHIPLAFVPEKATGKSFNIFFDIKDGTSHSIVLEDGALRVETGKVDKPSCIVRADANTMVGVFSGKVKAEAAFMQGKISATNLADMMAMNQVLSMKKAMKAISEKQAPATTVSEKTPVAEAGAQPPGDPVGQAFSRIPLVFVPEKATGKSFNIFFEIKDGTSYSIVLEDGAVRVEQGKVEAPSCIVRADTETIVGVFSGKLKPEAAFMQGRFSATNLTDIMTMNQVISLKKLAR